MSLIVGWDFDGSMVEDDRSYEDLKTPLRFKVDSSGFSARDLIYSLKDAGHKQVLWSARSAPRLLTDPHANVLIKSGLMKPSVYPAPMMREWKKRRALNRARLEQMLEFIAENVADAFTPPFGAIDDGKIPGKPPFDLFIEDRAMNPKDGLRSIARRYGDTPIGSR